MDANSFYEKVQSFVANGGVMPEKSGSAEATLTAITGFGEDGPISSHQNSKDSSVDKPQQSANLLGITDDFDEFLPESESSVAEPKSADVDPLGLGEFDFSEFNENTAPTSEDAVSTVSNENQLISAAIPDETVSPIEEVTAVQAVKESGTVLGRAHITSVDIAVGTAVPISYSIEADCVDFLRKIGYEVFNDNLLDTWKTLKPEITWDRIMALEYTLNLRYQVNLDHTVTEKYLLNCTDSAVATALMLPGFALSEIDADAIVSGCHESWFNSSFVTHFARNSKLLEAILMYMQNCEINIELATKYAALGDDVFLSYLLLETAHKFDVLNFERLLRSGVDIKVATTGILEGNSVNEFDFLKSRSDYDELLTLLYQMDDHGFTTPKELLETYKEHAGLMTILHLYSCNLLNPEQAQSMFLTQRHPGLLKLVPRNTLAVQTESHMPTHFREYADLELSRILYDMESLDLDTILFLESLQLDRDSETGELMQAAAYNVIRSYYGIVLSDDGEYQNADSTISIETYKQLLYLLSKQVNETLLYHLAAIKVEGSISVILGNTILHAIGVNSAVSELGRSLVIFKEHEKIYTSLDYLFFSPNMDSFLNPANVQILPDKCGLFLNYTENKYNNVDFTFETEAPTSLATWAKLGVSESADKFQMIDPVSHANLLECLTKAKSEGIALHKEALVKVLNMEEQEYASVDIAFGVILHKFPLALGLLSCANLKFALRILVRNFQEDIIQMMCQFIVTTFSIPRYQSKFRTSVNMSKIQQLDKMQINGLIPDGDGIVPTEDFFSSYDGILARALQATNITLEDTNGILTLSLS